MKIGLNGPQDVLALLVRRKWLVIAPFIAVFCALALLTYLLPRTYVSETLILVRPRDVPKDFVKDLISGSPEERLKAIEQTIMSRTNLVQILREFGDKLPEFERLNMDEKVVKLHGQINITFEIEKVNGQELPLSYFRIAYQNQNPDLAQKIASKLTSLFIEQDNRVRETQVFGTTEFLAAELDKISEQLNQSENKLKEVKTSRLFELPDQRDANLRTLDRLGMDKKTNAETLDRYAAMRLTLETEISQTPPQIARAAAPPKPITVNASLAAKVQEYRKAQGEYDELASKYTPRHPDVLAAQARLERVKQKVPADILARISDDSLEDSAEGETAAAALEPNPVYQKLIAQLQQVNTEYGFRQKDKAWLETEIAKYNQRVENTPKTEQDMAEAKGQNEDLKKQYGELKTKLSEARLSESLESKQKGSQFVIVDPANFPLLPAKPSKMTVLFGCAALSLLSSIAFAVLIDIARQKIWTQSQVEAFWGVPVLVDIPQILTDSDLTAIRRKKYKYAAFSVAGAVVWSLFLYGIYLKQGFVLLQLDPLLQKLVYK